ncbi:hypothetical protein C0J52_18746 [Blattella germanica]|nr:hypothetical protein C0J52_18746 [Blattella germanica]
MLWRKSVPQIWNLDYLHRVPLGNLSPSSSSRKLSPSSSYRKLSPSSSSRKLNSSLFFKI